MLDGAPIDRFDSVFATIVRDLEERGGLRLLRSPDGLTLIALDGSEHFHTFLGATRVAPGHETVVPLPPEFVLVWHGVQPGRHFRTDKGGADVIRGYACCHETQLAARARDTVSDLRDEFGVCGGRASGSAVGRLRPAIGLGSNGRNHPYGCPQAGDAGGSRGPYQP